jgi:hypothetical protein
LQNGEQAQEEAEEQSDCQTTTSRECIDTHESRKQAEPETAIGCDQQFC